MNERSFVYLCFIVLGAAGLLPWNIFITAHKYFFYKLRNVTNDLNATELLDVDQMASSFREGLTPHDFSVQQYMTSIDRPDRKVTRMQLTFEAWLTVTASLSGVLGSIVNAALSTRISNVHRMVMGHVIVLVSLTAVTVMTRLDTDHYQMAFFVTTIALANVANFASNGLIIGASMGLAARFPVEIIQGSQLGMGLVAVAIAATSIASQAITPSPEWNGLCYFTSGTIFTLISLTAYLMLIRTEYARTYITDLDDRQDDGPITDDLLSDEEEDSNVDTHDGAHTPTSVYRPTFVAVVRKVWYESLNTMLVLAVSLSVFPAVACLTVSSTSNPNWEPYFIPVVCFLLFNVGDSIGRFVTYWLRWPDKGSVVMIVIVLGRIALVPLIFLCNEQPRKFTSAVFTHDWQFAVLLGVMALSNGYCLTLSNMHGAKRVDSRELELAGSLFGVFCVVGVVLGSAVSFGLVHLL